MVHPNTTQKELPFTGSTNACHSPQVQAASQPFPTNFPSAFPSTSTGDFGIGVRYVNRIVNSTFTLGADKSPAVLKA